jgi:hypothetical protein
VVASRRLTIADLPACLALAVERRVPPAFDTSLMVRGAGELPGAPDRLFLPVMQALG